MLDSAISDRGAEHSMTRHSPAVPAEPSSTGTLPAWIDKENLRIGRSVAFVEAVPATVSSPDRREIGHKAERVREVELLVLLRQCRTDSDDHDPASVNQVRMRTQVLQRDTLVRTCCAVEEDQNQCLTTEIPFQSEEAAAIGLCGFRRLERRSWLQSGNAAAAGRLADTSASVSRRPLK